MSYNTDSYMLVGMRYTDNDLTNRAVEWSKLNHNGFAATYEKQLQVVDIMPKYKPDLDASQSQSIANFKEHLEEQGVIFVSEHRGFDYMGYAVTPIVDINDDALAEFCHIVKERAERLAEIIGETGSLISVHNYS